MDRFDRLSLRPVRVKVNVAGFDLERSLKQLQQKRAELKRSKQEESDQKPAEGADAKKSTHQNPTEPEIAVEPVIFGEGEVPKDCSCEQTTPFRMEL